MTLPQTKNEIQRRIFVFNNAFYPQIKTNSNRWTWIVDKITGKRLCSSNIVSFTNVKDLIAWAHRPENAEFLELVAKPLHYNQDSELKTVNSNIKELLESTVYYKLKDILKETDPLLKGPGLEHFLDQHTKELASSILNILQQNTEDVSQI